MRVTPTGLLGLLVLTGLLAGPLAADAQQRGLPVIGFLSSASPDTIAHLVAGFRQGLNEAGYVEGQNVAIDYRWAEGQSDRLPALATELVGQHVAVIVASGGPLPALAAKGATSTIPIVFTAVAYPIHIGLVASYARPGGNMTGIGALTVELDTKRLELMRELVPTANVIGVLMNPNRPETEIQVRDVQEAARVLKQQIVLLKASSEHDIETAFATFHQQRIDALLIGADPFFHSWRHQLIALAARYAIPTIYQDRGFASAGGLISYGPSFVEAYRQAGIYTGRVLKGEKPAELPVMQPTAFELVINLKTAQALGLTIPPILLFQATEVIR
jgi:putative tryptophan/tyrosine transport system substrate-binding protein